ncbi:MAG TPA: hypothetical protein VLK36_08995 [Gaiellaceae bacterium]|nr:hypothetical protein [Gaiellaceae bacterium]
MKAGTLTALAAVTLTVALTPVAAQASVATDWYWTPGLCKSQLKHYATVLGDGRTFYNANAYCVGTGGVSTCEWSSGHRYRLYKEFTVFVRAFDGTVRTFTLTPAAKDNYHGKNIRALGHVESSAKFDSFVAPLAAAAARAQQQKGCAPYTP